MKRTKNLISSNSISKQLPRASSFISAIVHGIQRSADLPTVKLAIFTEEATPSSSVADEVHFHKDLVQNFLPEWERVGVSLRNKKTATSLAGFNFNRLVCILTGVAFMKSFHGGLSYLEEDVTIIDKTALLNVVDEQGGYTNLLYL